MGFNSVLVILNDHLDQIERDPDFGKKVAEAIRAYPERTYITGQTQLISCAHADFTQVVAVGGNCGWRIESPQAQRLAKKALAEEIDRRRNDK